MGRARRKTGLKHVPRDGHVYQKNATILYSAAGKITRFFFLYSHYLFIISFLQLLYRDPIITRRPRLLLVLYYTCRGHAFVTYSIICTTTERNLRTILAYITVVTVLILFYKIWFTAIHIVCRIIFLLQSHFYWLLCHDIIH
jgi:hypothetical protein